MKSENGQRFLQRKFAKMDPIARVVRQELGMMGGGERGSGEREKEEQGSMGRERNCGGQPAMEVEKEGGEDMDMERDLGGECCG
jgi:hypothetical protein